MSNGDTVFTSSNGQFTLSVTDTGISLTGPGGSVTVEETGVTVDGQLINVQSPQTSFIGSVTLPNGALPVARVGDLTDSGSVQGGNPNVLA